MLYLNNQLYLEYEEKTNDKNNNIIKEPKNNELISKEYEADINNNESLEKSFSLFDTPNIIKNNNIYGLTDGEEINKLEIYIQILVIMNKLVYYLVQLIY